MATTTKTNEGMKDTQLLKGYQTQLSKLDAEIQLLNETVREQQRALNGKRKKVKQIKAKIRKIDHNGEIKVSEHAMLRYFERVLGFDLEEIESKIVTDKLKEMVETLGGSGEFPVDGFRVRMKDFNIVTILE